MVFITFVAIMLTAEVHSLNTINHICIKLSNATKASTRSNRNGLTVSIFLSYTCFQKYSFIIQFFVIFYLYIRSFALLRCSFALYFDAIVVVVVVGVI